MALGAVEILFFLCVLAQAIYMAIYFARKRGTKKGRSDER
jgi:hypothetical protein